MVLFSSDVKTSIRSWINKKKSGRYVFEFFLQALFYVGRYRTYGTYFDKSSRGGIFSCNRRANMKKTVSMMEKSAAFSVFSSCFPKNADLPRYNALKLKGHDYVPT